MAALRIVLGPQDAYSSPITRRQLASSSSALIVPLPCHARAGTDLLS
jgi:hypothetical protein